jgi:hypothetical protein
MLPNQALFELPGLELPVGLMLAPFLELNQKGYHS